MRRGRRPRWRDQRGQTTVLIVGFAGVLFLLVAVVVDASAAYLQRQGLATIADGAALAGADAGATGGEVYTGGLDAGGRVEQSERAAAAAVDAYLGSIDAYGRYPGLAYETRVVDGSVEVRIAAPLDLPLTLPGGPGEAEVAATGTAALQLG
ncbi:pilus assembly protein TadG-related protein [Nocardioides zeae]|uniref:Pilus assembly protein TadG-related protein n=1 Tax=Nocardioides imazamoxiresistens TaxID=3231893 RepID=A0ABU3PQR9_9ACTN|nr:pilus assembly protein TadG-related protein [Nocardioides zeae]MDT9591573.1 pilus assembly protein TadG-related protein [Nocardioides zeae]